MRAQRTFVRIYPVCVCVCVCVQQPQALINDTQSVNFLKTKASVIGETTFYSGLSWKKQKQKQKKKQWTYPFFHTSVSKLLDHALLKLNMDDSEH